MTTSPTPTVASVEATVEQHLHRFYVELQAWIDGGCRHHMIFRADTGMCRNLASWSLLNGKTPSRLEGSLFEQFADSGLDTRFPFNTGRSDYHHEREGLALYRNPARLAWIKAHAQPIGGEG